MISLRSGGGRVVFMSIGGFNADLVGAINILKIGAKLREMMLSVKTLLIKLYNPVRFNLYL